MIISVTMAEASATAEGELARTPLAHLLVYALDRRLTGAMFLATPDASETVIRLVRGVPVKVRPADRFALLGEMLIEAGAIDEATLQGALATQGLLGDVLLLAGRIERDVLEKVAEAQFVRRMVRLFSLPAGTVYRYHDGHDELAEHGGDPASVDPLALIWAGLREHGEASTMMDATLARLGEAALRLHPATSVTRFGLDAVEATMVEALATGPLSLAELGDAFTPEAARRLAYALAITRQIELGTGLMPAGLDSGPPSSMRPVSSVAPSTPPAARLSGTMGATANPAAATAVARMALRSTVHRLGAAAPDAPGDGERAPRRIREKRPSEAVTDEAAPVSSVEVVPPSAPAPSSGVVPTPPPVTMGAPPGAAPSSAPKPPGSAEEAAISDAATTLRSEIELPPAPPAPEVAASDPIVTTTPEATPEEADPFAGLSVPELFWLATEMVSDRDAVGAAEACAAGLRQAPDDPDLAALSAWAHAQLGAADLKALMVELDEILHAHEDHAEARYYRALLRRRLGDETGCVRDLERVAQLDPAHEGALRELGALEAKPPGKERPSLLERLFKR